MKCIPNRRSADLKSMREIFFAEPLVGDEFAPSHSIKDFENNPVGEARYTGFEERPDAS